MTHLVTCKVAINNAGEYNLVAHKKMLVIKLYIKLIQSLTCILMCIFIYLFKCMEEKKSWKKLYQNTNRIRLYVKCTLPFLLLFLHVVMLYPGQQNTTMKLLIKLLVQSKSLISFFFLSVSKICWLVIMGCIGGFYISYCLILSLFHRTDTVLLLTSMSGKF